LYPALIDFGIPSIAIKGWLRAGEKRVHMAEKIAGTGPWIKQRSRVL
jgi:hypothetical protein